MINNIIFSILYKSVYVYFWDYSKNENINIQERRRGHTSLIYRRILTISTPNLMAMNRLQNGLPNSRTAPRDSRLNRQNIFFQMRIHFFY
jgi:hypothetical protein